MALAPTSLNRYQPQLCGEFENSPLGQVFPPLKAIVCGVRGQGVL